MGTKSRESIYGSSIRASAERAREARKEADRLACEAWNQPMLGYKGPAQPSPALGDALNAGFTYLEVRCLGCDTHQTVALDIVRRPKSTGDAVAVGQPDCRRNQSTGHHNCRSDQAHAPKPPIGSCRMPHYLVPEEVPTQ